MSKKLGLESKYKQFIKPTKLGEYKAIMGKGTSFTPTKGTFKERRYTLSGSPAKFFAKAALSAAKRTPIGKVVSAIGKAVTSKPGMFGAGVGIGANAKPEVFKNNKKMGGGMMRYKTGSKDVVKGKKFVADIDDKVIAALNTAKGALSYLKDDASLGIKGLKKAKMNAKAKRLTKTEGSFSKGNAVKLSARQKVIAAKAPPPNKIDGKDFAVLKAEKAKGRGQGLQDEKMKPGKIMKADKGVFAEKNPKTLLRDLPLKKEPLRKTKYNIKDVYKLANKNKTGDRTTSKDVREAARILKVKLPPKAR